MMTMTLKMKKKMVRFTLVLGIKALSSNMCVYVDDDNTEENEDDDDNEEEGDGEKHLRY